MYLVGILEDFYTVMHFNFTINNIQCAKIFVKWQKTLLHFAINKKHFQACRCSLHAGKPKVIDHEQNPALSKNQSVHN